MVEQLHSKSSLINYQKNPCLRSLICFTCMTLVLFSCYDSFTRRKRRSSDQDNKLLKGDLLKMQSIKKTFEYYGLDIFVLGFPKCGTGSLRDFLAQSEEVAVIGRENSDLFRKKEQNDEQALLTLDQNFENYFRYGSHYQHVVEKKKENGSEPKPLNWTYISTLKRAIKNPSGIHDMTPIKRLMKYTDRDTKLIIGLRHPIALYQSLCNFHLRHGSYTEAQQCLRIVEKSRYDLYMKQLAKVSLTSKESEEMMTQNSHLELELVPNPFKIFVYHLEQLSDTNSTRANEFRHSFQTFLNLKKPVLEWPRNKVNEEKSPLEIQICNEEFNDLRAELLNNSRIAATWIRNKFIHSKDVIVGRSLHYFLSLLNLWNDDICFP